MIADGAILLTADGLPSSFLNVERLLGGRTQPVRRGSIETGDIVRQATVPSDPARERRASPRCYRKANVTTTSANAGLDMVSW